MQQSRPSVCLSVCHLNCAATGMHAMVAAAAEWMQWLPSSRHPKGVAGVSFPGKNFIPMKFMFAAGAYCGTHKRATLGFCMFDFAVLLISK